MSSNEKGPKPKKDSSDEANSLKIPARVLLAGEDKQMRSHLAASLRDSGYDVTECYDSVELLEELIKFVRPSRSFIYNLIISEIGLPSKTCVEFMEVLGKHEGFPPVILIMELDDVNTRSLAHNIGAKAVFIQPFEYQDLLATVVEVITENRDSCH